MAAAVIEKLLADMQRARKLYFVAAGAYERAITEANGDGSPVLHQRAVRERQALERYCEAVMAYTDAVMSARVKA